MQTANAQHLEVHPTELIEVQGTTDKGRTISIYIVPSMAKELARAFALLPTCQHLGHAFWHVKNPDWPAGVSCPSCQVGSGRLGRSDFEPEGGWTPKET